VAKAKIDRLIAQTFALAEQFPVMPIEEIRLSVAFLMAGGYLRPPRMDEARLVELHRLTLTTAARSAEPSAAADPAR